MSSSIEIRDRDGYVTIHRRDDICTFSEEPSVTGGDLDAALQRFSNMLADMFGDEEPASSETSLTVTSTPSLSDTDFNNFNGVGVRVGLGTPPTLFAGDRFSIFGPNGFSIPKYFGVEAGIELGKGLYFKLKRD